MMQDDDNNSVEGSKLCAGFSAVVVEDNPAILKLTVRALDDLGVSCCSFCDAESAISYLSTAPVPDLLLADIGLPGISGIQLVRELRRAPRFESLRCIIFTARTDIGDPIAATKLGALFFKKPFRLAELRDAVTHTLCGYRGRARIMIDDDDDVVREEIASVIVEEGFDAVEARDGLQALELLRTQAPPQLILLDIAMPKLDGVSTAQAIMSHRAPPPIVFISAREDVARQSLRLGVIGHLRKPIELPEVVRVIRRATGKTRPAPVL